MKTRFTWSVNIKTLEQIKIQAVKEDIALSELITRLVQGYLQKVGEEK